VLRQLAADRAPIPWSNGRGVQYEIVTVDDESGAMRWRLSVADLTDDAPFSLFAGVAREFCLAAGAGVTLAIDGVEHACGPGSITRFDGGAATSMRLWGGPCRAVNLMRPATSPAPCLRVIGPGRVESSVLAVVSLEARSTITVDDEVFDLGLLDAAHGVISRRLEVSTGSVVAVVVE